MALRQIGMWRETRFGSAHYPEAWPHPSELGQSSWPPERRERVVGFLRRGAKLGHWAGFSYCRFEGCDVGDELMGANDLTDGTWVWPEGLAHYVEVHAVPLPEELAAHVEAVGPDAPPPSPEALDPWAPVDRDFWIEWCASHTEPPPADEDAGSAEELGALAARLGTSRFAVSFEPAGDRWRVELSTGGRTSLDYLPRWSLARVESYLMLRRAVPAETALDAAEAAALVDSVLGAPGIADRVAAWLSTGTDTRPTIRADFSGAFAPPPPKTDHPLWATRSGTVSSWRRATDELGLRYWLDCFVAEGGNFLDAVELRHRRLHGLPEQ